MNPWYWVLLLLALTCKPPCLVERCATQNSNAECCCGPTLCACESAPSAIEFTPPLDFHALVLDETSVPKAQLQTNATALPRPPATSGASSPRLPIIRGPPVA